MKCISNAQLSHPNQTLPIAKAGQGRTNDKLLCMHDVLGVHIISVIF